MSKSLPQCDDVLTHERTIFGSDVTADQNDEEEVAEKEEEKEVGREVEEEDDTMEMRKEIRNDGSKFRRARIVLCAN